LTNGILIVNKEKGYTSHDVVAKMRGILKIKRIGHTGTLDPDATGVLPVCIGKATKLVDMITDKNKTYEAVIKLGVTTDTQDLTGEVLTTSEVTVDYNQIKEVIKSYIGEYMQLPPMFSAIKVNGKKLYELARQGKEIERERRRVIIHDIRILNYQEAEQEIRIAVDCGKGTYIRTLIHDIGETLGCGAAMKSLIRSAVGNFRLEDALTLSQIEECVRADMLEAHVIPIERMFEQYTKVSVDREYHKLIYNGNTFELKHLVKPIPDTVTDYVRVYDAEDNFIGVYAFVSIENLFKPVKMFL
jgi:tRNA pseudouridine55 synthase